MLTLMNRQHSRQPSLYLAATSAHRKVRHQVDLRRGQAMLTPILRPMVSLSEIGVSDQLRLEVQQFGAHLGRGPRV